MGKMTPSKIGDLRDLKILDDIREIFYTTTGLAISFHYPGGDEYDFYPILEKNPYCALIQSSAEGMARCLKSDAEALCSAREKGVPCPYTCHAGLRNVVIPLAYEGKDLGALFIGQLVTREQEEADFLQVYEGLESLGLPRAQLYESFVKVKVFEQRELTLATRLLTLMSDYIVSAEGEAFLQSELHEREREILRYENLQMQMKNDLQELSIRVLEDKMRLGSAQSRSRAKAAPKKSIIARAREFVMANYDRDIALPDVARAVYLSPNYFSTVFKEYTGNSFGGYLNEVRVQQGKRLLLETDLPIKDIVVKAGFKDYNYFNRTFRRIVGVPPGEFRDSVAARDRPESDLGKR